MLLVSFIATLFVVFVVALICSFTIKSQPARRTARLTMKITGAALAIPLGTVLFAGAVFGGLFSPSVPSMQQLTKRFPAQHGDLNTIVAMSDVDSAFSRIAPDWAMGSKQFSYGAPDAELPRKRWDQYRAIFSRNHISLGVLRNSSGDAFIMVQSAGLLDRGHAAGFLFCNPNSTQQTSRYEPCTSIQPDGSAKQTAEAEAYSFHKLADHWYAYDQGPG